MLKRLISFILSTDQTTREPKHWKQHWENQAAIDSDKLDLIAVEDLIAEVDTGKYGNYYNIWYSIASRASLEQAGWVLFKILNRDIDYLYRYHCAAALLKLLKCHDFEPVDLSGEQPKVKENIKAIYALMEEKIGPQR